MNASKTTALILSGLLAMSAVTACSSEDKAKGEQQVGTDAPATPTQTGEATGEQGGENEQPAQTAKPTGEVRTVTAGPQPSQPEGAIANVIDKQCDEVNGVWSMSAMLENHSPKAYKITVRTAVVKVDGNSVLADEEITKTLPAGKQEKVEAKSFYTSHKDDGDVQCVVSATKEEA